MNGAGMAITAFVLCAVVAAVWVAEQIQRARGHRPISAWHVPPRDREQSEASDA